jgi:hypothetical protein
MRALKELQAIVVVSTAHPFGSFVRLLSSILSLTVKTVLFIWNDGPILAFTHIHRQYNLLPGSIAHNAGQFTKWPKTQPSPKMGL